MDYQWPDLVGNIGVLLILGTYLLLQLQKLKSDALLYSLLNAVGAGAVLLSLFFKFNLSAFFVELFWLLISVLGIGRYFTQKRAAG